MNRIKHAFANSQSRKALWGALLAVLSLGISDTARAQGVQLTVSPTNLTFNNVPLNAVSTAQNVAVSANQATTVIIQVSNNSPWLMVSPGGAANVTTTPSNISVRVNTAGLNLGSYNGSFTISVGSQASVTVNIALTVGASSGGITATPATLSFSAQQGNATATPAGTTVQITTLGSAFNYTLTATTQGGLNWLLLDHTGGSTGDAGFVVSTNPIGLAGGVYNGTIIAQSNTTTDTVQIPVTLTVNSNASLTVSPANPPPFLYQINGTLPSSQNLTITATTGSLAYTVQVSPPASWLTPTPLTGVAGASAANLTLAVNPAGLTPGTYFTNVLINPQNGSSVPAIPVTLVVSANALLTLSTNTLNYTAQFAGSAPSDQTVAVTATGTGPSVGFTYGSDSPWLSASTSANGTPATLTVHVAPAGLLVGSYAGRITVRPSNGENYSQVLTVNLTVANASTLVAAPPVLLFSYQIGQLPPGSQPIQITSTTGTQAAFTLATSTTSCGANWLQASALSSTTPAIVNVTVFTAGMTAGNCAGSITVSYGSGQSIPPIPVTLSVSSTPQLVVSLPAGFGSYTAVPDQSLAAQGISLTSTDQTTPVQFTANSVGSWISLASNSGSTPRTLVVTISTSGLTPGVYPGTIIIASASLPNGSLSIPMSLTVTPNTQVTVTPPGTPGAPITFTQAQGGALPPAQVLTLASTGGTAAFATNVTTNAGGPWLQVSPTSGNASGPLTVSIASNQLSQGTYTGQIVLSLTGAATQSITINVTLNVTAPQNLIVNPTQTFTFTAPIGQPQPAPQKFRVTSGGAPITFTVGTTSSGWLSTDVKSGTTPADVNIQVNATGLVVGNYNGSVTVSGTGVSGTITLNVVLTVTAPPPPTPVTIVNNGSFAPGLIAPGEIITIFGSGLGPTTLTSFVLNAQGGIDPTLAGVQVTFNGKAGTPLHVSATQIDVIVPYEVAGQATTSMVVQYLGVSSAPFNLSVAVRSPGIYTISSAGLQAAALNQNGTVNGTGANGTSYASPDTDVVLYATGGGQTSPASATGSVTPSNGTLYRVPNVTATVGGKPAVVDFAGGAPGLVAGAIQLNIHIPQGLTGDALQVVVTIDGVSSPLTGPGGQGPSIAVR